MRVSFCSSVVVKTFFEILRPRPRPLGSGLETETKTFGLRSRDQDRDLGKMNSSYTPVSRPWSRDHNTGRGTLGMPLCTITEILCCASRPVVIAENPPIHVFSSFCVEIPLSVASPHISFIPTSFWSQFLLLLLSFCQQTSITNLNSLMMHWWRHYYCSENK